MSTHTRVLEQRVHALKDAAACVCVLADWVFQRETVTSPMSR